jgi:mRNA interferase RelE/StbE
MLYRLEYKSSVKKELRKLPKTDRIPVIEKIQGLKDEPRPDGSAKLKGSRDLFRVRYGDYRIIYQFKKNVVIIIIIRIGHRREVYRNL